MKPQTKSVFFKLSLVCFAVFFVQLVFVRSYAQHVIDVNQSESLIGLFYWLGLIWIGLGSSFYYKTTNHRQTVLNQILIFLISPLVFAPIAAVLYVFIVLLPLYGQIK